MGEDELPEDLTLFEQAVRFRGLPHGQRAIHDGPKVAGLEMGHHLEQLREVTHVAAEQRQLNLTHLFAKQLSLLSSSVKSPM